LKEILEEIFSFNPKEPLYFQFAVKDIDHKYMILDACFSVEEDLLCLVARFVREAKSKMHHFLLLFFVVNQDALFLCPPGAGKLSTLKSGAYFPIYIDGQTSASLLCCKDCMKISHSQNCS
jgi:hypothetical protein